MKRLLFVGSTLTLCVVLTAFSQTKDVQYYFNEARAAQAAKDNEKFYAMIKEAHALHPYHQTILYHVGLAAALNGKANEAIDFLTRAIYVNVDYDLNHPALSVLLANDNFKQLQELQQTLRRPDIHSDTALVVKDRSVHIESIAKAENEFFLGSINKRKIVRIRADGTVEDFVPEKADGLGAVFGLKIDHRTKSIWACSSPIEQMEGYDSTLRSAAFQFDIESGDVKNKFETTDGRKGHVFGDLTLAPNGDVYVSDSRNNVIFKANPQSGKLDEFYTSPEFWNLQGISFSHNGSSLFIADYVKGLYRLDMQSKTLDKIACTIGASLKSIDGLTYYKSSLIAIQNQTQPMRVMRYHLSADELEIVSAQVIDRGHPAFNEPTLGTLAGDTFYYIANSQWSAYTKENVLKAPSEVQDLVVLKVKLEGKR